MKSLTAKELCRLLERKGWERIRIHGSHYIYYKPGSGVRISVPMHGSRPLKKGLQIHILKLAGLEEKDI